MRTSILRASAVSALFTFTALVGAPASSIVGAAPRALSFHQTAPISYLPIRGAVVNANTPSAWALGTTTGGPSTQAGGRVAGAATVPSAPSIQSLSVGAGSITLRWWTPSSGGSPITNYLVRYSSDSGTTWTVVSTNATYRTFTVTGLAAIPYILGVAAVNAVGTGTWSTSSRSVTPNASATPPSAPSISSVTPGTGSVAVAWNAPSSTGGASITSYTLRDSTNGGANWTVLSSSITNRSYTAAGLSSSSSYVFDVAATNSAGTGAWSAQSASVSPLAGATVPGQPSITNVTPGTGSVSVAWSAPSSNGGAAITSYSVRDSANGGTSWSSAITGVTANPYTLSGLVGGTAYLVEVAAVNSVGTGTWSAPSASVTPLSGATAPGSPTITGVTAGTGSVKVAWTAPSSNGGATITSYSVRDSSNGGSSWSSAITGVTGSPYTVNGLTGGTAYVFEVAAVNSVGAGNWSAPSASVTPTVASTSNGIQYHGGPVLVNTVHVYEIWYGNWTTSSTPARQSLVDTFLKGIGGTPYFNTNSSYYDASGTYVQNVVSVMGSTSVTGSTSLTSNSFASIVAGTITSGALPADSNGVYFVFTSANVAVSGFLTQYCGFHSAETVNSTNLQYAFVGDPSGSSIGNCAAQTGSSPNGDVAGDAMVSVIAHELSEATSDPLLNAWYNTANGEENGDLCAWTFGPYFRVANGSAANVTWTIGGTTYQFLIQQNWVNASGGYCALSY